MEISVPLGGYNSTPMNLPALDFSGAVAVSVSTAVVSVPLSAGVYYLVSDIDFQFDHGTSASGVRAPGFANVYLAVFLSAATSLRLIANEAGVVKIIPAETL